MAAHHKCVKYIEEISAFAKQHDYGCEWKKACQLGSCGFRRSAKAYLHRKHGISFRKVNGYLGYCGFEVTTIDTVGKRKELHFDLGLPIEDESLLGAFDLVISFATIEHIEDQYELFRNIHDLCKVGGVVILNGPTMGTYKGHGTWKYDFEFFWNLFMTCGYRAFDVRSTPLKYKLTMNKFVIYASYSKTEKSVFVDRDKFIFPHYDRAGHEMDIGRYAKCQRSEEFLEYDR